MIQISLFKVGLVFMLFFILASLVLNIVSIASTVWTESGDTGLWISCVFNNVARDRCFLINPPALIATGTALNCLAFVLIVIAQLALFLVRFRDSFALYFVIGAELASILSLIFNTIGWYFVFFPTYQQIPIPGNIQLSVQTMLGYRLGWSFWLMTPSFFCSAFAAMIGAAILGCTCVTNKFERERRIHEKQARMVDIGQGRGGQYAAPSGNYGYYSDSADPQVLRL